MTKKDPLVRRKLTKERFLYIRKRRDRKQVLEHEPDIEAAENTSNNIKEHQELYPDWIILDKVLMNEPSKKSFLTKIMRFFGLVQRGAIEN